MDYCSVFAERYDKLGGEKADSDLPDVEFVHPILVRHDRDKKKQTTFMTLQRNADEMPENNISYDDVLNQNSGSRLLLQGRPGCGKTRLMKQVSSDLAERNRSGENRKFVIYVKLREMSEHKFDEQNPEECLLCAAGVDLSDGAKKNLLSKFDQGRGNNVIFVLDGFDECDPKHESTKFIREIIMNERTEFENSIVIASSRPSTTYDFQKADNMEIVEIIGFKRKEVFQYLDKAVSDRTKGEKLKEYLEGHPKIMNLCYLPLYCAMLVQFSDSLSDLAQLPQTESGFYKHFTLSTYNRYSRKKNSQTGDLLEFKNLLKFESLKSKRDFEEICKFAYERTEDSKPAFTDDDFSSRENFDFLVSEQVFVPLGCGRGQSYSFVHLTFQEYLAAIYIAWYCDAAKQEAVVAKHCSESTFLVVWQFLFGILKPFSDELFKQILDATEQRVLLHVRCAYESQQPKMCTEVLEFHHNSLTFFGFRPTDLPCLAYVLKEGDNDPAIKYLLHFDWCDLSEIDARSLLEAVGDRQLSLTIEYVVPCIVV